jgi:hypothetical protein
MRLCIAGPRALGLAAALGLAGAVVAAGGLYVAGAYRCRETPSSAAGGTHGERSRFGAQDLQATAARLTCPAVGRDPAATSEDIDDVGTSVTARVTGWWPRHCRS